VAVSLLLRRDVDHGKRAQVDSGVSRQTSPAAEVIALQDHRLAGFMITYHHVAFQFNFARLPDQLQLSFHAYLQSIKAVRPE